MATYHLNVRYCSKSKGQSAKAKSDYINRKDKYSERLDDLQYSDFGNMPKFAENNPQEFWQLSDIYERENARVCTEIVIALPRELTLEQNTELVQSFVKNTVDSEQNKLPYSFAIHNDKENHNPHCHLIFSERQLDGIERPPEQFFKRANSKNPEKGGAKKTADFRDRDFIRAVRTEWRRLANEHLTQYGHAAQIDERSYQEQGLEIEPRSRLDRVTWKELSHLEQASQKVKQELNLVGKELTQEQRYEALKLQGIGRTEAKFRAALNKMPENRSKSSVEPLNKKPEQSIGFKEKSPHIALQGLSQVEFDRFLIENWLKPAEELGKLEEKRNKLRSDYENYGKQLDKLKAQYAKLDEKKQGFLGLWETRGQKQHKDELKGEFERIKTLYNAKGKEYNEHHDNIEKYRENVIKPLQDKISDIQKTNPSLKMRNLTQLQSIKFKGLNEWHRESQQRQSELEKKNRAQQRGRSGLSL